MRIVFVNLHINEFLVKNASKYIFKQSVAIKHKYFLDYLLSREDIEVCSYVNKKGTSIASNLPGLFMKLLIAYRFLESKWVLKKNHLNGKIKILKHLDDIKQDDIVIVHQLYAEDSEDIKEINAFKVMSMLHFHGTQSNSKAIQNCKPDILIGEANLNKYCKLFQKYYSWASNKKFLVHPFVFEPRFKRQKPFSHRINKVFSTGTITYKIHPEFIDVYGDPCDQPIRKYAFDHKEELTQLLDCYNSDYSENANSKLMPTGKENKFMHLVKAFYYKFFASQQKSYYSFNMVEKFNDYKMCLIGEEILGIPGIGFVEGMACGCAYIGQTTGFYEDYGMIEGKHYIGYDGTPEDLIAKIKHYQLPENQSELEQIANNGYEFVQTHCIGESAAKKILQIILRESE